ncbi:ADAMTS-like protein 5, partial [Stegodyphus mimosarum]
MCGVCGGQNASCVHYKDVYQGQLSPDSGHRNAYHEVVVIPTGARNLIIRQSIGKNYLALQDRNRGIIFNGEQIISKHGNYFDIAGTSVEFTMLDNLTETLSSKGPITQELYVLVLLRSHNPGIYYEYWLPELPHNPGRQHYPVLQAANANRPPVTVATPVKSQSYTVSYYNPKPVSDYKPHHRPTKPAYAYGYGEKPYKSQDAPIFRHIPTTTAKPRYDYPQKPLYTAQYPNYIAASVDTNKDNKIPNKYPYLRADPMPAYVPRYLAVKPEASYYQTYRNFSGIQAPKVPDINKEYPVLTQGDSSNLNGRNHYQNTLPNAVLDDQKVELSVPKTLKSTVGKRADMPPRTYITNGRLKYSLDNKDADEVYVNSSG